jgi:TM2 domain-containing membrane protein YozV
MKYCRECGKEINEKAVVCIHCGCSTGYNEKKGLDFSTKEIDGEKCYNKWIALLLWFFLGGFGGHRFYVGDTGGGILMAIGLFTSWLVLPALMLIIFLVVDLVHILGENEVAGRKLIS